MSRICPHCNYARQATDSAPDWQCPSCAKAYVKAGSPQPPETLVQYGPNVDAQGGGLGKWLLILIALGAAFWFGRPLLQPASAPIIMVGDGVVKGWNEQALRQMLGPWI